jgi:methyl-accepting chemotaxis protein
MADEIILTGEERYEAFREINAKSDRIMGTAIFLYFGFGLVLSMFYGTFFLAASVGGLCLAAYFLARFLLPDRRLYQYVMSAVLAIFSAQFIYQMHGLFEMHFFFFVGSALLITYRNWKLIIPLLLITVIHHAAFAWLQYKGMKEIYFTQLDYMDLQAFIFHAFLAAVIMGICGYWAFDLERATWKDVRKNKILARQLVHVRNNIAFADNMSKGNLDVAYELADESDGLGKSLMLMQENLKKSGAREMEEKFITVGITTISDIIRQHSNDPVMLADEFIKGLVKYTNMNQGALFLHEEGEGSAYLNLAACYAYDRKKYLQKKVGPGEGLVGQCFLERDEIYMTTVPAGYIRITSGLGEATPGCILIVPVKTQDEVVGVIELASFRTLKTYEKQFIHKAAENIASAVISSRTTERIKKLLVESQQSTEELRSQEEEVRQNMEELSATQEEMSRKAIETENRVKAIEESGIASIEFNVDGTIVTANKHFLDLMGYSLAEIRDKHHRMFVDPAFAGSQEYADFWADLRRGIPRPGEYSRVTKSGAIVFIKGSYSIIRDHNGRATRILKLASDITLIKKQQEDLQKTLSTLETAQATMQAGKIELEHTMAAVDESMAVIEFDPNGEVRNANSNFLKLLGYDLADIKGRHHRLFVNADERESEAYRKFWSDLAQGKTVKGEFSRVDKLGNTKWIRGNYSPIKGKNGKVERIIKIAYDISAYKS